MRRLLVYLKDYKKESILAPLFKLLEASFELIVPLVVAAIINKGIAGADRGYVIRMCGVLIGLAAIGFISAVTAQFFAAKAAIGFSTKLRRALFKHIESLSFAEMDNIGTSTLITRMTSDINQVQTGVNMFLRLFLRSPFIVFGAMAMAFTVDVKGALIFVVTIPVLSVVVFGIMLLSMPMYKKVQAALDRILGRTRENLEGARVIRAFNKQTDEMDTFNKENELLTNMQLLVGKISALMNPVTFIVINCATIALIWIGGLQVDSGRILRGDVVALVNYMSQILVELVKLADLIILINKSLACAGRIEDVLNETSSINSNEDKEMLVPMEGADRVTFKNVGMVYSGSKEEALSNIDFSVKRGETIGIIGGTGSGKSSLVHLIPRFYDVSSGTVLVDGHDVREYPLKQLRDKVGMVMQKAVLFKGTIAENLRWGNPEASDEQLWKALEIAQATEVVQGKEEGLEHIIEQGGRNLSGGQRQRLTIARALVKDPEILILDDSASALDFATDAALRQALKEMQGDRTIFIVSQRTSSIQFADQIIVLDDGNVEGIGTHDSLLKSCETYREIYESQFKKEVTQKGGM